MTTGSEKGSPGLSPPIDAIHNWKINMKTVSMILAAAAIAAISAAPASARHLKHSQLYAPQAQGGVPYYAGGQGGVPYYSVIGGVPYYPGAYHQGPDPWGVYFGNQMVGRDPDPNVRQQLQNDYSYLYAW
jgi:hypothetical protein